jgi:hypothetical protein
MKEAGQPGEDRPRATRRFRFSLPFFICKAKENYFLADK